MADDEDVEVVGESQRGFLYKFAGKKYSVDEYFGHLRTLKAASSASWWPSWKVELAGDGEDKRVVLRCTHCKHPFQATNPSRLSKTHLLGAGCQALKRVIANAAAAAAAASAGGEGEKEGSGADDSCATSSAAGAASASSSADPVKANVSAAVATNRALRAAVHGHRSGPMDGMFVSAEQQQRFTDSFSDWFYQTGVPLHLTSHPQLKEALAVVGLQAPSRKAISGPILKRSYDRVKAEDKVKMGGEVQLQLAADGWRRYGLHHACAGPPLWLMAAS
jgi:hypothetical protein